MAYLKSSVKNGLETPSERFLRRFLDQTTQQLYLLPPLFFLSCRSGVPTYVRGASPNRVFAYILVRSKGAKLSARIRNLDAGRSATSQLDRSLLGRLIISDPFVPPYSESLFIAARSSVSDAAGVHAIFRRRPPHARRCLQHPVQFGLLQSVDFMCSIVFSS